MTKRSLCFRNVADKLPKARRMLFVVVVHRDKLRGSFKFPESELTDDTWTRGGSRSEVACLGTTWDMGSIFREGVYAFACADL